MLKKFYRILIFPYIILILYLMFFGMDRSQLENNEIRLEPIMSTVIYLENEIYLKKAILIVVGNLLMFMPFGFLGWVFTKFKDLKSLVLSFLSIIIILEALQYFTRMGVFDIDDIIINTLGVGLGWKMCQFFEKKFTRLVL